MRFLANGSRHVGTIQWRANDGSTPWINVGDPIAVDPMGYFNATRTAPLPLPRRVAWRPIDPPRAPSPNSTSPGSAGV